MVRNLQKSEESRPIQGDILASTFSAQTWQKLAFSINSALHRRQKFLSLLLLPFLAIEISVETIPVGTARMAYPKSIMKEATDLPSTLTGTRSP